jgi:hypothetical protein
MTKFSRLLYVCAGVTWVGVGLGWVAAGLRWVGAISDGNEAASTADFGSVGLIMASTTFVGWFAWKNQNLSLVVLPLRLTMLAHTLLSWWLYVCVGVAWVLASVAWVDAGLAIWDGNKAASAAVFVAVGAVMFATFTTAVGSFAWMQRN